jgi:DNA-binding response OmpR family regulator
VKKILIIEDDPSFADQLKTELSTSHQVEICPDGQSGYYAIYEYKPDAVLLDLTIAQMGAVSLVGKMKAQKQFSRLPIFVLADTKTMTLADEALAAGANQAFLKDDHDAVAQVVACLVEFMAPSLARQQRRPAFASQPVAVSAQATQVHSNGFAQGSHSATVHTPTRYQSIPGSQVPLMPAHLGPTPYLPSSRISFDENEAALTVGQAFLDIYGQRAHSLRKDFIAYRTAQGSDRKAAFERFLKGVSGLNREAREFGFEGFSRYLTAVETRVTQLLSCLDAVAAPSLQILASALDVITALDNHLAELRPLNHMAPHALIVDDENVSRKALCLGLEKAKIKTTGVDNPDAAIVEAEGTPFDIIFLDVELPKMNGFALCARLRLFAAHRKTPILFVTSLCDMKSRASSRVSGGNQFLTKPVNYPELTVNAWTLVIRKRILEDGRPELARP